MSDWRLAGRSLRGGGIGWITLFSAIGFFVLFTCLGKTMTLWKMLQSPCVAMVYLEGEEENAGVQTLTSLQAELAEEEQVESVSRWVSLEGTISDGTGTVEMTVQAVETDVLEGKWIYGGRWPENTAMVYVVLNEAAWLSFRNIHPNGWVEWETGKEITLVIEEQKILARVTGVLQDGNSEASVWLAWDFVGNITAEEGLIPSLSQSSVLTNLEIEAEEAGFRVVGQSLTSDGWVKLETDEWENARKEICFMMFLGLLFLVIFMVVFWYYESVWQLQEREAIEALRMMGWSMGRMRLFSVCRGSWFGVRAFLVGGCLYWLIKIM